MVERVILVDYENVQPIAEELQRVDAMRDRLKIFHGPGQNSLPIRLAAALLPIGPAVELIQCEKSGKDALDFHLAFHLGRLSVQHPQAEFVIVSRDRKGFAQMVEHGIKLGCRVMLVPSMLDATAAPATKAATGIGGGDAAIGAKTSIAEPSASGGTPPREASTPEAAGSALAAALAFPARKAPATKAPAKKVPAKKAAAKKAAAKKAAATKAVAKKASAKDAPAEKPAAKKAPAKKGAAGKTASESAPAKSAAKTAAGVSVAAAQTEPLGSLGPLELSPAAPPPVPSVVPIVDPAPALKTLRQAPAPADVAKVIAGLSKVAPDKRPAKAATLLRHLESHLRADLTEAGVAELLRSLRAQGWISDGPGGKVEYHLQRP
ncbi:PIN domain-containing protein [Sphaerotilus microaerophilus]|uniref:PIN-like domain-containing protein n=1 Tax=Sphaerotilus microaerophilus TaxID=2914710 RepID=A0ABM7YK90_9BURK|nr:PIN domain-containing protein [Sphaerotilus sp. FB-5]BDI04781.1 hypothetical protein CATMQ487_17510 [Sphaerotilus sp. FB-5]